MRIAMVPIGSHGDVLPVLALAGRLQREGHAVRLISGDDVAAPAATAGLPFRSIGLDVRATMAAHRDLFAFARHVSPAVVDAVTAEPDVDAVLATFLGVAAGGVARQRGLPFLYAVPVPGLPTRELAYPTSTPRRRSGRANLATHRRMARIARLAFPSARTLFELPRPEYLHCFSTHVVPRPADWEPFAHVTGYWFGERTTRWEPEPALQRLLDEEPRPLCVTFGSTVDRDPRGLARILAETLRRTDRRAVVVAGWSGLDAAELPGSVVVPHVPFDWLFDRVDAVVHHGGAGTTALALRAGLPQVVVPSALDQPFWAERLHALGVAPAPIPRRRLTADRLVAALNADDAEMRAQAGELGTLIAAEDGAGVAVRTIEAAVADPA